MLVELVVADLKDLEVLQDLWRDYDGQLERRVWHLCPRHVELDPVVHAILDVADAVDVAQDLERMGGPEVCLPLDLLLSTVGAEVLQ